MKDSGIDWIGQIPTDWEIKKLKFSTFHRTEKSPKNSKLPYVGLEDVEPETGKLLSVNDEMEESDAKIFLQGDVLFGKLRPYLAKVILSDFKGRCTGEFLVLMGKEYNSEFLKFLLLSDGVIKTVDSSTYGAKMPRAEWQFIGNMKMPIPNMVIQKKISQNLFKKIKNINGLISQNQKLLELLEEKLRVIINYAVTKGFDPTAPMQDSGIVWMGDIPEHWKLWRLGWLCNEINDINHEMPESVDEGIPFLSSKDIAKQGPLTIDVDVKKISVDDYTRLSEKVRPKFNDVIYSRIGTIGKAKIVKFKTKFLISYSCCVVRVKPDVLLPEYCACLLNSNSVLTDAILKTQGIGVPDLGINQIKRFKIPLCPIDEQRKIFQTLDKKISKIDSQIQTNQQRFSLILNHSHSQVFPSFLFVYLE